MTRLWDEKKVAFKGEFYSTKGAILEPKPVQKPHPPLWFGTKGKVMLQLAAKYGTGWIPTDITLREYKKYLSSLGENPSLKENFVFSISDRPSGKYKVGDRVRKYAEAGCEYYCMVLNRKVKEAYKQIERFGELKGSF